MYNSVAVQKDGDATCQLLRENSGDATDGWAGGWQFFLQIDPLVQIINVISVIFIYVDILIAALLVAMILTEIVIFDSKVLLWFRSVSTQPPFHIPTPASAHHYDLFMRAGWGGMGMLFCLSSYDVQIEGENFQT